MSRHLTSLQVLPTVAAIGGVAHLMFGMSIPASVVVGAGLALSSTAVAIQVLRDKNEIQTKHGRAAFGVLLFQVSRVLSPYEVGL